MPNYTRESNVLDNGPPPVFLTADNLNLWVVATRWHSDVIGFSQRFYRQFKPECRTPLWRERSKSLSKNLSSSKWQQGGHETLLAWVWCIHWARKRWQYDQEHVCLHQLHTLWLERLRLEQHQRMAGAASLYCQDNGYEFDLAQTWPGDCAVRLLCTIWKK